MTNEVKQRLYSFIKSIEERLDKSQELFNLISSIWSVYQKPSTGEDNRFRVLGDEINKHYFMNDDWPQDKLYVSVLHILDDDNSLLKFITGIINIARISDDSKEANQLSGILHEASLIITHDGHGWNIKDDKDEFVVPIEESIPFIRCRSEITHTVYFLENNVKKPDDRECFILTFNDGWDDYGYKTWFTLYYKVDTLTRRIGRLKIMKHNVSNTDDVLPNRFFKLGSDFCSLGYEVDYYQKMYEILGERAFAALGSLRDIALYPSIRERFEKEGVYTNSLLRFNVSEKALREGRFYVYGKRMDDAYHFSYHYEPKYDKEKEHPVDIPFRFLYNCYPYQRMIGLIGENGVGKSTLLNDIIKSFISNEEKEKEKFNDQQPVFSKIVAVSYSPFDRFPPIQDDYTIEYHYCGLLKPGNQLLSIDEQTDIFIENVRKVLERGSSDHLRRRWRRLMMSVIDQGVVDGFCDNNWKVGKQEEENIRNFCRNMSSGESIYVYSLTEIMANIRYDTLLLFDEPEQHLHPSAITTLMKAVYDVLEDFESYAIVATHSPLVIREMISDNVYTFERNESRLSVAKIGMECFGEDISTLSDVVFGNMSESKKYEKFVEEVAKQCNYDYNAIVSRLTGQHNKLSLDLKLLIKTIINRKVMENAEA